MRTTCTAAAPAAGGGRAAAARAPRASRGPRVGSAIRVGAGCRRHEHPDGIARGVAEVGHEGIDDARVVRSAHYRLAHLLHRQVIDRRRERSHDEVAWRGLRRAAVLRLVREQGIDEAELLAHRITAQDGVALVDVGDVGGDVVVVGRERAEVVLQAQGGAAEQRMTLVVGDVDEDVDGAVGNLLGALYRRTIGQLGARGAAQGIVLVAEYAGDLGRVGCAEGRGVAGHIPAEARVPIVYDDVVGGHAESGHDPAELLEHR